MNYQLSPRFSDLPAALKMILHMSGWSENLEGQAEIQSMSYDGKYFAFNSAKMGRGDNWPPLPPALAYKGCFKHGSPHVSAHLWAILRGEEYSAQCVEC